MGLKRKRSMDQSPLSTSSYTASTPEAQSPTPLPDNHFAMDMDISPRFNMSRARDAHNGRVTSSDLGCRTRKRFRDNRPDESVIHEHTINKLFEAQRSPPHAAPVPVHSHSTAIFIAHPTYGCGCCVPTAPKTTQKSTLHSFWNLPAPPVQQPTMQMQHHQVVPRCSDCDRQLLSEAEAMDVDLDMDMGGNGEGRSEFSCADCGKNVCGACAVVSNARHCLQCATAGRRSGRWW